MNLKTTNNMFDDIRPYYDSEIFDAMQRIAQSPTFPLLASYVFPERQVEDIRAMVRSIDNIRDFQFKVMYQAINQIISKSITQLTYAGIENVDSQKSYLYVSNHRDITLDASLLQNILVRHNIDTSEITFGANLMQGELIIDIGKSNKMFRVERPSGNMRDFYRTSKHLSEYIRSTLLDRRQSVWIAQRNGRTKDGIDRTDQGIINMFRMSCPQDKLRSVADLNILPIAVSYEWESCDILKAIELYLCQQGPYVKREGEDLNSILKGITQPKGCVHIEMCKPLTEQEIVPYVDLLSNEYNKSIATLIDRRICSAYHLMPNNYIASDILTRSDSYAMYYTAAQRTAFVDYMSQIDSFAQQGYDVDAIKRIFLGIYANPIESKNIFAQ